jgi:hypothetical protein
MQNLFLVVAIVVVIITAIVLVVTTVLEERTWSHTNELEDVHTASPPKKDDS